MSKSNANGRALEAKLVDVICKNNENIQLYMLSGDKKNVALKIGEKTGIKNVLYEMLPQDKYELLSSKNKKCYCRLHSQWNLKGTKTEAYYDMNTDFTLGICLDIFVLDNIPNDGLRKKIFSIKQTLIRKLIWSYEITNSDIK